MMKKKKAFVCTWIMLTSVLFSAGCGYRLAGKDNPMLAGINTIAVPYFKNDTFEAGIESVFTNVFANEFINSKRLQVVNIDQADVILRGTIKNFREQIISYNQDKKALEYRVFVSVDLRLEKRDTGEVLWKRKRLTDNEEYQVSSYITVTQADKTIAVEKMAQDLAQRVYESIIQGF
jgi:outer membrane lipopolysaccharide assembly protein LptE/RlpB